jgi:hypothetical protein
MSFGFCSASGAQASHVRGAFFMPYIWGLTARDNTDQRQKHAKMRRYAWTLTQYEDIPATLLVIFTI